MVPQSFFQLKKDQCSINLLPAPPFFIRLLGQEGEPCIKKGIYYCKPSPSVLSLERWSIIFSFKNMRQFIKFTTSEPVSPHPTPYQISFVLNKEWNPFITNSRDAQGKSGVGVGGSLLSAPLEGIPGRILVQGPDWCFLTTLLIQGGTVCMHATWIAKKCRESRAKQLINAWIFPVC